MDDDDANTSQIDNKKVICTICHKKFKVNQDLLRHLNRKNPCKPNETLNYLSCNLCNKEFKNKQTLNIHIKKIHCKSTSQPINITNNTTNNNNNTINSNNNNTININIINKYDNKSLFFYLKPDNFIEIPINYINANNVESFITDFNPKNHNAIIKTMTNILSKEYILKDVIKRNIWLLENKDVYLYVDNKWIIDINKLTLVECCIKRVSDQLRKALDDRIKLHLSLENTGRYPFYKNRVLAVEDSEMNEIVLNRNYLFNKYFKHVYEEYKKPNSNDIFNPDGYHNECQKINQYDVYKKEYNDYKNDILKLREKTQLFTSIIDQIDTNETNKTCQIRNDILKMLSYDPIKHRKMIIENCRRLLSELGDDQSDPNSEVYSDILAITDS